VVLVPPADSKLRFIEVIVSAVLPALRS
jgi:hypothetical protein